MDKGRPPAKTPADILVVGSIALDSVKTPLGKVEDALGGSAIYFPASAGFFAPVRVVGVVGTDFDMKTLDFLSDRNVDLSGIAVQQGKTLRWSAVYAQDMNTRETLDTQLNVFADFRPSIPQHYRDSRFVFLGCIQPELQLDVLRQVRDPALTVCDTIQLWIDTRKDALLEVLAKVDVVVLNDSEALQLTAQADPVEASHHILSLGPKIVIIKRGEHGAWMISEADGLFEVPAFPVASVVDPTGAGDGFAGGVLGYLAEAGQVTPRSLREAMIYGTVMASFVVERFSVEGLRHLDPSEIHGRYQVLKQAIASHRAGGPAQVDTCSGPEKEARSQNLL